MKTEHHCNFFQTFKYPADLRHSAGAWFSCLISCFTSGLRAQYHISQFHSFSQTGVGCVFSSNYHYLNLETWKTWKKKHPGHKNPTWTGTISSCWITMLFIRSYHHGEETPKPKPHHQTLSTKVGLRSLTSWTRNVIILATLTYLKYAGQQKKRLC